MTDEKLDFETEIYRTTCSSAGDILSFSDLLATDQESMPVREVKDIIFSGEQFLFIIDKLKDACQVIDALNERLKVLEYPKYEIEKSVNNI